MKLKKKKKLSFQPIYLSDTRLPKYQLCVLFMHVRLIFFYKFSVCFVRNIILLEFRSCLRLKVLAYELNEKL